VQEKLKQKIMTEELLTQFEHAIKGNDRELIERISAILEGKNQPQHGCIDIIGREHITTIIGKQEWTGHLFCPELGWHYNNNPKNSEDGYGTLHSHYAIQSIQAELPKGFRVADEPDWDKLIEFVGDDAGTKLRSKTGWRNGKNGTDEFGFNALPAGYSSINGSHSHHRKLDVFYWSASVYIDAYAWRRCISYDSDFISRINDNRSFGLSIRGVRDIE
jgi:uncharacterized protein (TIGR02145 family)